MVSYDGFIFILNVRVRGVKQFLAFRDGCFELIMKLDVPGVYPTFEEPSLNLIIFDVTTGSARHILTQSSQLYAIASFVITVPCFFQHF